MKKQNGLFKHEVEIESKFSLQEAYLHLRDAVCEGNPEWYNPFFVDNQGKSFRGYVSKERFSFSEFHYLFNLYYMPLIEGEIEENSDGSKFKFRIGLKKRDKFAYIIYDALLILILLCVLAHYFSATDVPTMIAVIGIFLLIFLIVFLIELFSFKIGAKLALKKLKNIIN